MSDSNVLDLTAEDSFAPLDRFKRTRLSRSQLGLMIDFMTLNPEIIHPRAVTNCSKEIWQKKWEDLAALLNADWTGAKRGPEKWRKSWHDQKCLIRARATKRDVCKAITGNDDAYKLNDLEEKFLKLLNFCATDADEYAIKCIKNRPHVTQETSSSNYIILGGGATNAQLLIESAKQSSSKLETDFFRTFKPRYKARKGLQSSSDKPEKKEETNSILVSSPSSSNLNSSQNISDIQPSLKTVAYSSEIQTQKMEESKEKEKNSSFIVKVKPVEASENVAISSVSESNQQSDMQEKTAENFMNHSVQNSSRNAFVKKRRVFHQPYLHRKNEFGIAKLLQRQNKLLEGIAGTLTRIERSVKDRAAVEVQRKNSMLVNISENIERLAESLGTVSKSLKTIADN